MIYDLATALRELAETHLPLGMDFKVTASDVNDTVATQVLLDGRTIGAFYLSPLPGNAEVVVSHNVWLQTEHQGKGYGSLLNRVRLIACTKAGVKSVVCTVNITNSPQLAVMERVGWKRGTSFTPTTATYYMELG